MMQSFHLFEFQYAPMFRSLMSNGDAWIMSLQDVLVEKDLDVSFFANESVITAAYKSDVVDLHISQLLVNNLIADEIEVIYERFHRLKLFIGYYPNITYSMCAQFSNTADMHHMLSTMTAEEFIEYALESESNSMCLLILSVMNKEF